MSKVKVNRLESELERCRLDSSWKRLQELLPQITAKGSGLELLVNFITGETSLELFLDGFSGFPKPNPTYQDALKKTKKHLLAVFDSNNVQKHVALETHLLLGKLSYVCGQFDDALTAINKAKLEQDDVHFHSLRTLRLACESYAIKGLCLESQAPKSSSRYQKSARDDQILVCFEKSTDLALKYLQELEKFNSNGVVSSSNPGTMTGSGATGGNSPLYPAATTTAVSISTTGAVVPVISRHEQIGPFIDTALQRVPISYIKRSELQKGVEAYRKILGSVDKAHTQNLQQILSRQLSEVLLRGVTSRAYKAPNAANETPDSLNGSAFVDQSANHNAVVDDQTRLNYDVAGQTPVKFFLTSVDSVSNFCPENKLEEAFLLLSISESIVCKEAVLSRAEDHAEARDHSLQNVKAVQNLLTLVLSALREYQLMSDMYERAMKFAYEDRYIWFQFALSLICQSKYTRAASVLQECISLAGDTNEDATQYMVCAKVCVEQLGLYDQGVALAQTAVKICRGGWLSSRAHLLIGLGYSLKAQSSSLYSERKLLMMEAIRAFEDAISSDPKDHLGEFFLALQFAINRNSDEAKRLCKKSLARRADQPVAMMLLGLLYTADNHYSDALNLVEQALEDHPTHYGLLVLRMKLEMKLQKTESALLTAKDLLLFWRFPSFSSSPDRIKSSLPNAVITEALSAVENKSTDATSSTMIGGGPSSAALAPNSSMGANLATNGGIDVTDKESIFSSARPLTEYGGAVSTVSDSLALMGGNFSRHVLMQYRMQANIWLELAELFLDGNFVDEVQECVEEACAMFPNSHQALYLKGRLHQAAGRTNEAKGCYLGALGIFPNHIPSMRCLASVYEQGGNLRMSEQVLRELVKIDPLEYKIWFSLGNLLAKNGHFSESNDCLRMAVALEESSPLMPFSVIPRVTHV